MKFYMIFLQLLVVVLSLSVGFLLMKVIYMQELIDDMDIMYNKCELEEKMTVKKGFDV